MVSLGRGTIAMVILRRSFYAGPPTPPVLEELPPLVGITGVHGPMIGKCILFILIALILKFNILKLLQQLWHHLFILLS